LKIKVICVVEPYISLYLSNISKSVAGRKIHRDQCVKCYDDSRCLNGLDICLKCFSGFCRSEIFNHSEQHFKFSNHCIMMNIKQRKKEKTEKNEEPQKITKLAIGKPGGADFSGEEWEQLIELRCLICNKSLDYEKDTVLKSLVTSVLNASSENEKEDIKAWEEEIFPCEHTLTLVQNKGIKIAEKSIAKCNDCDLSSNLWLCLTCGNLSCGRKETGGNQHAIAHFKKTSHPLKVDDDVQPNISVAFAITG